VLGRPTWGLPANVSAWWHGGGDKRASVGRALTMVAQHVGRTLASAGFAGPAGVDALVYRRRSDGALQLYPLLEVNPRMTLGQVGLALERRMAPGRSGLLLLVGKRELKASGASDFAALLSALSETLPLQKAGRPGAERLRRGAVALNDPARAQMVMALWLVAPTGGELKAALDTCGPPLPWAGCAALHS